MTIATSPLPPASRHRRTVRLVANAFLLVLLVVVLRSVLANPDWGSDARVRHHIVKAWQAGLNPYDPADVTQVAGEEYDTAYIYPPDTLPLWTVFSWGGLPNVRVFYLGFQLLLLGSLIVCWRRFFLDAEDRAHPLFFLLCLVGLNNTLLTDLRVGNISVLEQALLWWGMAAWLRGRHGWFAVLLFLASACKLTPLAFSVLLLLSPVRRWGLFAMVWLAMAMRLGLDRLFQPTLFHEFVQALTGGFGGGFDGGRNNPCLIEVLKNLWQQIDPRVDPGDVTGLVLPAYLVIVLVVLTASWFGWRAICRRFPLAPAGVAGQDNARGVRLIFLVCLTYALTVPRMKDYSYILLLPVVWQVGKWFLSRHPRAWLVFPVLLCISDFSEPYPLKVACILLWRYFPYFAAATVWVFLLRDAFRPLDETSPAGSSLI